MRRGGRTRQSDGMSDGGASEANAACVGKERSMSLRMYLCARSLRAAQEAGWHGRHAHLSDARSSCAASTRSYSLLTCAQHRAE